MTRSRTLFGNKAAWPPFVAVNDTVRGGKSTSSWTVDSSNVATFSGNLGKMSTGTLLNKRRLTILVPPSPAATLDITALGGAGFASQAASFDSPVQTGSFEALELVVENSLRHSPPDSPVSGDRGVSRPTSFVLSLKNQRAGHRPDGRRESVLSYESHFTVEPGSERHTIVRRWSEFEPTYRGRPDKEAPALDPNQIVE